MVNRKLVIGASGFLGSHVTRTLVERGEQVRAMVRSSSSLRALEDLDVEYFVGDISDTESIRTAMSDCDAVFYRVVDARPWLRDPRPLFRTNVENLRTVLEVASKAPLKRFVYTSSIATLPISSSLVDEGHGPHNWLPKAGEYVRSRVAGEELVLEYARTRQLPAVAMCVANTYGAGDFLPTPHGSFVAAAARGKMPVYFHGTGAEVVGVRDAAAAMVLAGERGRIGERYIISAGFRNTRDILNTAAETTGAPPPKYPFPRQALGIIGLFGEIVAAIRGRDSQMTRTTMRLMHIMTPLDNRKARRELDWHPRPPEDAIREAAHFFCRRPRNL